MEKNKPPQIWDIPEKQIVPVPPKKENIDDVPPPPSEISEDLELPNPYKKPKEQIEA